MKAKYFISLFLCRRLWWLMVIQSLRNIKKRLSFHFPNSKCQCAYITQPSLFSSHPQTCILRGKQCVGHGNVAESHPEGHGRCLYGSDSQCDTQLWVSLRTRRLLGVWDLGCSTCHGMWVPLWQEEGCSSLGFSWYLLSHYSTGTDS